MVAVCDADAAAVEAHQAEFGTTGYTDYNAMFAAENLDLVVICVPHHVGRAVITAAAEHGVHVLKEKPFAISLDEARELAAVCDQAGIEVMVTLQRRFNPIYTAFPQLADQIGTPFVVDAQYTLAVADPAAGWRGRADLAGGGCLVDMGYHVIDLLLWYFGLPDRVLADTSTSARPDRTYDAEDTALVHFAYASGLYGSLLLSRSIGPKTEQLRLAGTDGTVILERGRLRRLDARGNVIESLTREQSWPAAATAQVDHFARVIAGTRENPSGPASHLAHLAFITACYTAARTGASVNPKELL